MNPQTRRQKEVLDFIRRYIESHGYRPSYQVIARHMGVSSRAGIARIVGDLEAQGFLERKRVDGHFGIFLKQDKSAPVGASAIKWLEMPRDGGKGGEFDFAEFPLPEFILGGHDPADIRAFRVADDSLSDNAISRGDIALIELRSFARDGDIVAAVVESRSVLLRRFYRAGASIELRGAKPKGTDIRLSAEKVVILGVLRGLIRPLT